MDETHKSSDQTGSSPSAKATKPGQMTQDMAGQAMSAGRDLKDEAVSAGKDLKDKAMDLAGSSAEAIKSHASDFADAAKDFASQAGEKVKQAANDQKSAGAEYVGNLADTMRRAAREFDSDLPTAATYIRKAASQVEAVSDTVRNGNFGDLARSAQSFARRQPTAFLSLSVLAGFGVVRFLKSSASTGDARSRGQTSESMRNDLDSSGYRPTPRSENREFRSTLGSDNHGYGSTSNSDNRGYRDEFSK
jgi:hypothetical protein